MNSVLASLCLIVGALIVLAVPAMTSGYTSEYGDVNFLFTGKAVLLTIVLAAVAGLYAYRQEQHGKFLLQVFIWGLLIRLIVGTLIFAYRGQDFFGGDAITYDALGQFQLGVWAGDSYAMTLLKNRVSGIGMAYYVGAIYYVIGRNMLAIQFINAVLGAITAPIIFICAQEVFNNVRVSRLAALGVAFFPSLILWSSQGLKDGPIVFLLALTILATLKLGHKLTFKYVVVLICTLSVLLSLRFYLFYMIAAAVAGAFVVGTRALTTSSLVRQFAVLACLGLALTYMGVTRFASIQLESYGNLQRIERSRKDAATSAKSGFGEDVDVSSSSGAISNVPLGLLYLFFAPFPWQVASLRQMITLPEMIVWWASFPMMVLGVWFSIKYRLRMITPILIFTTMLSLAYSIFQGNVGTAYRQRAQLLVFYFIFAAVGYVLVLEKREEKKRNRLESTMMNPTFPISVFERRS
jgi:Dolichyl-phosphate-mannose-protein mannosyltransferase